MERLGWIALGGAVGALLRHGLAVLGERWSAAGIPLTVLSINVLGSFAAGALLTFVSGRPGSGESLRLFAMVGVLGAFTTFSAFSIENAELLREGAVGRAALHALLHVSLSIGAAILGAWAAR